jgi:ABC-type multidrug transport system fused ATPase/permease subunit
MLYGVILVAMMLFRPEGLIPSRQRKAELREALTDPGLAARAVGVRRTGTRVMSLLELTSVRRTFGGLVAVNDLSFKIELGSIVAMIGPNGAGKSTVFNLITGIYQPTSGTIALDGRSLRVWAPTASRRAASRARFKTSGSSRSCRRSITS